MYADIRVWVTREEGGILIQVKDGLDLFDELEKGSEIRKVEIHKDGVVEFKEYRVEMGRREGAKKDFPLDEDLDAVKITGSTVKALPAPVPGTGVYNPPKILPMQTDIEPIPYAPPNPKWMIGMAEVLADMHAACGMINPVVGILVNSKTGVQQELWETEKVDGEKKFKVRKPTYEACSG